MNNKYRLALQPQVSDMAFNRAGLPLGLTTLGITMVMYRGGRVDSTMHFLVFTTAAVSSDSDASEASAPAAASDGDDLLS